MVDELPPGWLHPEVTCARLTLPSLTVATEGFRATSARLEAPLETPDGPGTLEVCLLEDRPVADRGPFLDQELELLEAVARLVAATVDRVRSRVSLDRVAGSIDEAVLTIDGRASGREIVSVNAAAERMFGYGPDELVGRATEILHVDRAAFMRFGEEGRRVLAREGIFHAAFPLRRKDGSVFDAEQTVVLLDQARGLEGGALSIIRDVSERQRAEADLAASRERFQQIAEHITDVFWIYAHDVEQMLYVSPAYERIWGRSREERMRDPFSWFDAVLPADRPRVQAALTELSERPGAVEYRIRRPDGEVRWIHDRSFPVTDPDGTVRHVVGVASDITERKRAEERLGILGHEISEVICVVDREGTVLYSTPSVLAATGYSKDEFEGMNALALVHEDDREALRAELERVGRMAGESARAEYRVVTRAGAVLHVESEARNLLDRPGVDGILITTRDISARREMEERLRQSQKLESVGRLAGGIAHDFNNLLTVIRSQTDLVRMDVGTESPVAEELEVVLDAVDRASTLTNQLLAFSRDQVLQPRVVDLCEVVLDMSSLVRRVIGEDIEMIVDLPGDLPTVEVDPHQLEQVVLNLAVNARDAMPGGGTLHLRTFEETVDAEAARRFEALTPGRYTVLEVSDTGIGMDERTRARMFEPFFTTRGDCGGTGLGLSMAYGFVRQTGGDIEVVSAPGEGTTLRLRLPGTTRPAERPAETRRPDPTALKAARGRVLLIEDDPGVRRAARRVLELGGLETVEAEDVETALEMLEGRTDIDLVLTDLVLPGATGTDLLHRLAETRPQLPVVVMSGYSADSPGHRGHLPADVPFLPKPFTPESLLATVRSALLED